MNIVVLAGGLSPERDVSLASGSKVANALMKKGHRVVLADLFTGLDTEGFESSLKQYGRDEYVYNVPSIAPDLEALKAQNPGGALVGKNIINVCRQADVVFLALHGSIGENGQMQALLDLNGILYTGSGFEGSVLAMDKSVAKEIARFNGIPTPDWKIADLPCADVGRLCEGVGLPCVVKPCGCGSSVGISIVEDQSQLEDAISLALEYENSIILEQKIIGREFSVGILDGESMPAIEIIPKQGFFDYKNKYQPGMTQEICPADLTSEQAEKLGKLALKAHNVLRLGGYSRVDFMMDAKGDFYFLEANTLPGMTPSSLLPQEASAAGIGYDDLCEAIVRLAAKQGRA